MMDSNAILNVKNLKTYFFTRQGVVKAVDDISFELRKKEILCILGETGSGKTVTALSILRLLDYPAKIVGGEIVFHEKDLLKLSEDEMRKIRGSKISMIFQNPSSSLNPVFKAGEQVSEAIMQHLKLDKQESKKRAIALMKEVGIPEAEERYSWYPHQFSGGMNQRIMIAMAISCSPEVIIADEPTSNLDVTIESQILDLFLQIKQKRGASVMFITHNFGVVARIADRVIVMRNGKIVEHGDVFEIFDAPKHPYTIKLLSSLPNAPEKYVKLAGGIKHE